MDRLRAQDSVRSHDVGDVEVLLAVEDAHEHLFGELPDAVPPEGRVWVGSECDFDVSVFDLQE